MTRATAIEIPYDGLLREGHTILEVNEHDLSHIDASQIGSSENTYLFSHTHNPDGDALIEQLIVKVLDQKIIGDRIIPTTEVIKVKLESLRPGETSNLFPYTQYTGIIFKHDPLPQTPTL